MKPSEIMKKRYVLKLQEVKHDYEKQTDADYHEEVSQAIDYSIKCMELIDKLSKKLKQEIEHNTETMKKAYNEIKTCKTTKELTEYCFLICKCNDENIINRNFLKELEE